MPPEERDPTYLWDMLDAARTVREFTAEGSAEGFSRAEQGPPGGPMVGDVPIVGRVRIPDILIPCWNEAQIRLRRNPMMP